MDWNGLVPINSGILTAERQSRRKEEIMNNREWLMSLTDKELSDLFEIHVGCGNCPCGGEGCSRKEGTCAEFWENWLKSEHESN